MRSNITECKVCQKEANNLGFPTKYPYCSLACYEDFLLEYKRVDQWEARIQWINDKLRSMTLPATHIEFYDKIKRIEAPTDFITTKLRARGLKEDRTNLRFNSYFEICNPKRSRDTWAHYYYDMPDHAREFKAAVLLPQLKDEYAAYVSRYLYGKVDREITEIVKTLMVNCMTRSFYLDLWRHMPVPQDPDLMSMVFRETKGHLEYMLGFTEGRTIGGGYPLADFTQFPSPKLII